MQSDVSFTAGRHNIYYIAVSLKHADERHSKFISREFLLLLLIISLGDVDRRIGGGSVYRRANASFFGEIPSFRNVEIVTWNCVLSRDVSSLFSIG